METEILGESLAVLRKEMARVRRERDEMVKAMRKIRDNSFHYWNTEGVCYKECAVCIAVDALKEFELHEQR
tara:strand:- start:49 stop:261 length:213 start_codon:yes stop_codon:yes gene_type:complete